MGSDDRARRMRTIPPVNARVAAPASKSLTIRALAAAALAGGRSLLGSPLLADDPLQMASALRLLGIPVTLAPARSDAGPSFAVEGCGGVIPAREAALDLGDAGTPLRILAGLCTLGHGRFVIDGSERMRHRPAAHLVQALRSLGVSIVAQGEDGCPPLVIDADGFPGGRVRLRGSASSQFLTSLLMTAPGGAAALEISVDGPLVSRPYIDLTIGIMEDFGVPVDREGSRFLVKPAPYRPRDIAIEGDASSASYLFAAAAVTGGRVEVTGIPTASRQGDLRFLDLLEAMGCRVTRGEGALAVEGDATLRGIDVDLAATPDIVPTLACVALFAGGATRIGNVSHLRLKESDRIETVAACARALGAGVTIDAGSIAIAPPPSGRSGLHGGVIDPVGDHRLAMAFAVAGLAIEGVTILDPGCVSKSFPGFFDVLDALAPTV